MDRRAFVRLVGGGAVLAASRDRGWLLEQDPGEAIAAWHGPGAEPDPRRWILAYAILAPHPHNLQSWLVDLRTPGRDPAALRSAAPAARDRPVLAPDHDEPRHLPRTARPCGARARPARRHHALSRRRVRPDEDRRAAGGAHSHRRRPISEQDPLFPQIPAAAPTGASTTWRGRCRQPPGRRWREAVRPPSTAIRLPRARSSERCRRLRRHRDIAREAGASSWSRRADPRVVPLAAHRRGRIARYRDGIRSRAERWSPDRLGLFDRTRAPGPDDVAVTSQRRISTPRSPRRPASCGS